jgi:hypothetical protein
MPVFSLGLSEKEDGMGERISDTATEAQEGLVARWRKHIQDQSSSRLTQKAYCSGQGLSIQVFRHWKYQKLPRIDSHRISTFRKPRPLGGSAPKPPSLEASGFLPVEVLFEQPALETASAAETEQAAPLAGIEVHLSRGARIVLRQNFHQDALRRAVEILEC